MIFSRCIATVVLLLAASASHAFDFKSIGPAPVVLYDAPSVKGGKLFIAPSGMPVQILLGYGEWVKLRDMSGDLAWTEAKHLSAKRSVIVRIPNTKLRASANDAAPTVMTADKGVLLELVDPQVTTWVRVRHKDGIAGFVKASDIWGI